MRLATILLLIGLILWIAYQIYLKRKERKLIEQVTPITRGEKSERKVILSLLKEGINPKAIFHDLYIQKPNREYTQIDVAVATKAGIIVLEVKIIAVGFSAMNIKNIGHNYWHLVSKNIAFITQ